MFPALPMLEHKINTTKGLCEHEKVIYTPPKSTTKEYKTMDES